MLIDEMPLKITFGSSKKKKKSKDPFLVLKDLHDMPCYKKGIKLSCKLDKKIKIPCPESEDFEIEPFGDAKYKIKKKEGVCYLKGISITLKDKYASVETEAELNTMIGQEGI